jgi:hypothetical protein
MGNWWRSSRYEVRGGCIRAATGAKFEAYDPQTLGRGQPAAYQSLVNLLDALHFRAQGVDEREALTPRSKTALVSWCEEHGLLGVLPHRVHMLAVPLPPPARGRWAPPEIRYIRTPTGWIPSLPLEVWERVGGGYLVEGLLPPNTAASTLREFDLRPTLPVERVVISDLRTGAIHEEPVATTWARFFPSLPRTRRPPARYPLPLTERFWRNYAEPVDDFIAAALALRDALDALRAATSRDRARGVELLNHLVAPISVALTQHGTHRAYSFQSPSLLATLAMIAMQDLTKGQRPAACLACGVPFLARTSASRYCTIRCRSTEQKRRQRKGAKASQRNQ